MRVQFTKEDWDILQIPGIKKQIDGKWYVNFYKDDTGRPMYSPVDFVKRYIDLNANQENKRVLDNFFNQF